MARIGIVGAGLFTAMVWFAGSAGAQSAPGPWLSPIAIAATADGKTLFVAAATGKKLLVVAPDGKVATTIPLPGEPTGLAAAADGRKVFVTLAAPANSVAVIDVAGAKVDAQYPAGAGACSPVLSPKGDRLYVCSRFVNAVTVLDTANGKVLGKTAMTREPIAAGITSDGARLVVANHLPAGAANADHVAAVIQIIDTAAGQVSATLPLPNGSSSLRGVAVSPDNKLAAVTHLLSRFNLPTTQLERGWMNTNALTLVDVPAGKILNTILLDDVDNGAANPWGVAFGPGGKTICVAQSGTHEVSILDTDKVVDKLAKSRQSEEVPNDLAFLVDLRQRIKLPSVGPRAILVAGEKAYLAGYFSDDLSIVDLPGGGVKCAALGPKTAPSIVRKGEILFHDATICFQQWQSCASCHPDVRVDALNWDLMNDGIGNPKNTKSMLLSHKTPPAMSTGVRDTAETAVRSGIRFILFAVRPEEEAVAMDEFLKSLKPVPSPLLVDGKLSEAAKRGEKVFNDATVGCAKCHSGDHFTDMKHHNVGTTGKFDKPADLFDTPALIEGWRTAPFLHDGSAATMRDVVTTKNNEDKHGKTSQLTKQQVDDLVEYLMSL